MSGDAARPWWPRAALDETLDPLLVARPSHRDGHLVDLVVDYANPAAQAWGNGVGVVLARGTSLAHAPRFATYAEVFATGRPVLLSAVPSEVGTTVRFVDLRVTRVVDHLVLSWRDVSEQVAAERGRIAAEARFEVVLENYPDPSMLARPVLDADGVVADLEVWFLNRAAREWGATPGARLGARPDAARQRDLLDAYLDVARTGRPMARDGVPITVAGEDRLIDVRAAAVDEAIVATWRDVTSRRRAEQAVHESEQRFRLAFDDAPVGMAITDVTQEGGARYVRVNRALAAMLGLTPERMTGRKGAEFTHPDHRELDESLLERLQAGQLEPHQVEKRMLRADGSTLWVKESAAPAALDGRPTYVISHVEDVTERRAAEAELERRALYDPLTGLANRVLLLDHLAVASRELRRSGGQVAVLYLDLDRFKDVNDTLGHAAGDEVLREVAERVSGVLRPDATAARLAGDEFVVATRVEDDLTAVRIAERLHAAIVLPIRAGAREIVARPSIGVATSDDPDLDPDDLLRKADVAMYHAKHRGAEAWALYDDDLHALAVSRLAVEEDLRTALAQSRFRLLYQPVVDLADGRVVAAEALLRLDHPEHGLLRPASFLDVAEDCQLIVPIGGWALVEAVRQLAQWQTVRPDMGVSVNISPRQVRHLVLCDQVKAALDGAGTSAGDLLLEITEHVLLDADAATLAELRDVTAEGCGLAIDDFGTGYSSLANLTRFPVTEVKIDRTFVAGLGVRKRDAAVVEAIIGLAETLGLGTVAEGVETPEQLTALRELGCSRAQGFHLGRPMTGDELGALLEQDAPGPGF